MKVELLNKEVHNREAFDCGTDALNKYLREQASSAANKRVSRTNVLVNEQNPEEILGYHTLNYIEVTAPTESKLYKKYPHKLPALLLGRLAVDNKHKGNKFGEYLLIDAIYKTAKVDIDSLSPAPIIGLVVDAKLGGQSFYEKYGFSIMDNENPMRLWLPIGACVEIYNRIHL